MMVKVVKQKAKPAKEVMGASYVHKPASRPTQKRILLLRRRVASLLEAQESLQAKNLDLVDSLNKEKNLNSDLQKQVFDWQRVYHEAVISLNTYKVKYADCTQIISRCLKDINVAIPHIVGISDVLCRNKSELTGLYNNLRTLEGDQYVPKTFVGQGANDSSKEKRGKRTEHMVGPMVKGLLIQKPTIRLERVMLHQPQDQGPANGNLSPTEENGLSPITEEIEEDTNMRLGQISMRRRKHRLGSGERWRMKKKQEQLEKERQMERNRSRENRCSSVAEESSDSDTEIVRPIIRLQRVSGLLLSPNLIDVDRKRASECKKAIGRSSEPEKRSVMSGADPMEGCSWMNIMHSNSNKKSEKEKPPPPESSDSSNEDSDTSNVSNRKSSHSNVMDSLYKNKALVVCRKSSLSSSSADMSRGTSEMSRAEPDSTSNFAFPSVSPARDSLCMNSSSASVTARKQLGYSDATLRVSQEVNVNADENSDTTALPTADVSANLNQDRKRSSSFCNNCTLIASPEVPEKRIRKPKVHLYPGEGENNLKTAISKVKKGKGTLKPSSKVSIPKLSTGRKSLGKSSLKNNSKVPKVSEVSPSSTTADRSSQGISAGSSQKKKAPKKSGRVALKKSYETPRNSAVMMNQSGSQGQAENEPRGSRRIKVPKSYKESPLNAKMRRT